MSPTASGRMVERLIEWGVDTAYGFPGGINGFYEALRTHQDRIPLTHVRHEKVVAMGAYGKFAWRPTLCGSTVGPGVAHLLNGFYVARIDQSAVVDPHEMSLTPVTKTQCAKNLAWSLTRGEPNREMIYFTSSAGIVERAKEKLPDALRVQFLFRKSPHPGAIAPLGLA